MEKRFAHVLKKNGKTFELQSEAVLAATGVRPNTEGLNLKLFGIKMDRRGCIEADENMCTSVPGIYAVGDVTENWRLPMRRAHWECVRLTTSAEGAAGRLDYSNIPKCTYTVPEVASAGLTEEEAKENGYDVRTAVFPLSANGKAIAYGDDTGFVKLVYDEKYGQLLGMHMAGIHVTEMIWGAVGYLGMEMTVEEMAEVVHPTPTVSEAVMEAAHIANGKPVHI